MLRATLVSALALPVARAFFTPSLDAARLGAFSKSSYLASVGAFENPSLAGTFVNPSAAEVFSNPSLTDFAGSLFKTAVFLCFLLIGFRSVWS